MDNPQHSLDAAQLFACNGPPWSVRPCKDRLGNITSYDVCLHSEPDTTGVAVVASVYSGEEIARLIAAAPELYEALEKADALIENLWKAVPWGQTFDLDIRALNETPIAMKRALSKARGSNDTQP